jgi:hypothetical protein
MAGDLFFILSNDETNLGLAQSLPSFIQFMLTAPTGNGLVSNKLPTSFNFASWTQVTWGGLVIKSFGEPSYNVEVIIDSVTLQ